MSRSFMVDKQIDVLRLGQRRSERRPSKPPHQVEDRLMVALMLERGGPRVARLSPEEDGLDLHQKPRMASAALMSEPRLPTRSRDALRAPAQR